MTRRRAVLILATAMALLAGLVGGSPADAAYPGANGKITWITPTGPSGPTWDIWTMNPDGTEPTNLTPSDVDDEHPAWSPDGSKIAFARVSGSPSGCFLGNIYVMNADGTNVTQLTTYQLGNAANEPTWSPDGTRIAYTLGRQVDNCNNGDTEIWVMQADGSGQRAITSGGPEIGNSDGEPAWSPDGTRIAFTGHRTDANNHRPLGIFTIAPDGSQLVRLTGSPISFIRTTAPAWSPDGQRIAYERKDGFSGSHEIWLMNADSTGKTAVTRNGFLTNMSPAWSPDGRQIAFSGQNDLNTFDNEIFVIDVDNSGQTAITNNTLGDSMPDWQPLRAATVVAPPSLTDTDPDSPVDDNEPRVKGSAPGAVTVTLFTSPDCSGTPAALGTVADFSSPGLHVTVPDDSSTTFHATSTNAAGDVSACSSSSITYVEASAPPPPTPQGIINIVLDSNDARDFRFTGGGPGELVDFTLDDDGLANVTFSNQRSILGATAGQWTIEQQPAIGSIGGGLDLAELTCTDPDGGSSTNLATRTALIDLDDGETITCTFKNRSAPPDTTPPTLTLPAGIVVDATGPAGATVAYSATASDDIDPSPSLTCTPSSGSVFPIGTRAVDCSATDSAGNSTSGSFTIRIRGAAEQIARLILKTHAFLDQESAEALAERLQAAAAALAANRTRAACTAIRAYQSVVRRLPVILLAPTQSAELLSDGIRIGAVVGC